ncbi:MAG: ankyrin repeat domain-containing protein [Armatimonadota bacterium]
MSTHEARRTNWWRWARFPQGALARVLWLLPIFLIIHLALSLTVYLLSSDSGALDRRTERELQLFLAIEQQETKRARRFIESGVNPNAHAENGSTILHAAVQSENCGLVEFLVSCGAQVNAEDSAGDTPLYDACAYGNLSIMQFLLEHGADVNHKNKEGETPLFPAVKGFNDDFPTVLKLFLALRADPRISSQSGRTLLHMTAEQDCVPAAVDLLRLKLPVDARDSEGVTPLMEAAESGSVDCLKPLLAHGANVNLADDSGTTALHRTVVFYDFDPAALLLASGAQVNARDNEGKTPYRIALDYGPTVVQNLLRAHGGRL